MQPFVTEVAARRGFPIAYAMRRVLRRGYTAKDFRADVIAGIVVGIVALPLSMALAIAVGAPPQQGLYTAIFAGFSVSLLGGCKFQVTGPTAAFVVILAPIVTKYGLSGLLTAGLMAGFLLIAMGVCRLGDLIKYVPHPVTTGFTTGIATVIATLQVKDLLGLSIPVMPEHYLEKIVALWGARGSASWQELLVAMVTLGLLVGIPRWNKHMPPHLIAIAFVAGGATLARQFFPSFSVHTIGTQFHSVVNGVTVAGIPSLMPKPAFPWGQGLSFAALHDLFPAAFAIAMLGAIESLLSAVIADGMTGTKHDPNAELVGLGIGNIIAPIFGGIAATGALARTATNIRAGARSPIACAIHSIVVLLAMLMIAPLVAYIPMASLAAVLILVAWNMSELRNFIGLIKIAPRSDVFVLLTCFVLTVFVDMVSAISIGFILAAVLFMRRMAAITQTSLTLDNTEERQRLHLPDGAIFYEVNGPLFFGAAQRAMEALHASHTDAFRLLILNLGKVSVIDATGFVALESAIASLAQRKKIVVIAGPLPEPRTIFEKARLGVKHPKVVYIVEDVEAAIALAQDLIAPTSTSQTLPATGLAS